MQHDLSAHIGDGVGPIVGEVNIDKVGRVGWNRILLWASCRGPRVSCIIRCGLWPFYVSSTCWFLLES